MTELHKVFVKLVVMVRKFRCAGDIIMDATVKDANKKLSYPLCLLGRAVRRTTIMIVRRKGYDSLFFLPQSKHFVRELGKHDGCKDEAAAEDFSGAHRLTKDKPAADEREG